MKETSMSIEHPVAGWSSAGHKKKITMANILALAGLLSLVVMATEGCSCFGPVHPQEAVCKAPLMVRATVVELKAFSYNKDGVLVESTKSDFLGKHRYELKIHEIYRTDGTMDTDSGPFYLYTNAASSMCGISLDKNVEYVISMYSSYDTKEPSADICSSYIQRWVDLAEATQKNFKNQVYVDACKECKVKMCPYGRCDDQTNDFCLYNPYLWNDASCLKEGRCVRQETGECDWNLKECGRDEGQGPHRGYALPDEVELHPAENFDDNNDDDDTGTEGENVATPPDVVGEEPDTVFSNEADIIP